MANALGYVTETKTGFEGALAMMNLSAAIRIEKNSEKAGDGQPDYRIFAGETSTEIGGGWMRKANCNIAGVSATWRFMRVCNSGRKRSTS